MSGKYRLLLLFWGALFLVSVAITFAGMRLLSTEPGVIPNLPDFGPSGEDDDPIPGEAGLEWSMILSAASAVISAAGFVTTTYFALRSDRRQSDLARLEIEHLAKEIELQKLEIERLKREQQQQK